MSAAHSHFHPDPESYLEPRLLSIPAAWFLMGSALGQDCERPVHRVWIDAFALAATSGHERRIRNLPARHRITRSAILDDKNFNHPQQPVTSVSWFEADHYCQWLSSQTGRAYHFPLKPNGSAPPRRSRTKKFSLGQRTLDLFPTTPLAGKPDPSPSPLLPMLRLYNLCDNVHEWCSDWYDPNYYAPSPDAIPAAPNLARISASANPPAEAPAPPRQSLAAPPAPASPRISVRRLCFRMACDL